MKVVCRPLVSWPTELRQPYQRDPGHRFRAGWDNTLVLLERETEMIGGRELVIQLAVSETELRRDGWPKARSVPRHPGVTIVVPDSDHGRLSWSTDRYADWTKNVRAIALSMEALRAADRHGVMAGRQYAGFRELGSGAPAKLTTVEDAAQFLVEHGEWGAGEYGDAEDLVNFPSVAADYYRYAAKRLHPDLGGDPALFQRLQEARDLLELA